ncbi:CoA transferase [Actinoplanes bogorensis]|uniref:CoA transferase n=1 Tax=Paractinoplanes bogorensis TaxID=1610840 RepID=A0ABS5YWT4_9ACTN|nr:CaiB/BaiF CoA-transferase family protein [Actinoplanes bogorensis]MBU2667188.1 CoA transferase [Actinoplanes bogorensis]
MSGLDGVTVLDLSQGVSGPFSTRLLAQMGARVIKVERPGTGEIIRDWDTNVNGMSSGHAWVNPGKESLTLNLKSPEGQDALLALVGKATILIENYVPGTLDEWGLTRDRMVEHNPELILCRISGFGQTSASASRPALDLIIQGEAGLISTNGTEENPAKLSMSVVDLSGSMYATIAMLLAVLEKRSGRTGPIDIDIPLFDTVMSWTGYFPYMWWYQQREPGRVGLNHHTMFPYGPYEAGDGRWLIIAAGAGSWAQWSRFCTTIDAEFLLSEEQYATNDLRLANRDELQDKLVTLFKRQDREQWLARFQAAGIPAGALNSFGEAMEHERVAERGLVRTVESAAGSTKTFDFPPLISGFEPVNRLGPPAVGEHTASVLAEIGLTPEQIAELSRRGIV